MISRERARELRRNATDAERRLWSRLRANRFNGIKFKRQQPIGVYIVDFVCFEARYIIELDGGQHAERRDYDARRDAWLRVQGFTVLRFWNSEVMSNLEGALEKILEAYTFAVSPSSSPSPQPLPRQGGGAQNTSLNETLLPPRRGKALKVQSDAPFLSSRGRGAQSALLKETPLSPGGRGGGGEGV